MGRRVWIFVTVLLASLIEANCLNRQKRIVGGQAAAKPPEDDPVVYVNRNDRDARIYGTRDPHGGFYVFRGIRFGEPPVGRSRFQRSRPAYLEGEYNATKWGPPCPQPNTDRSDKIVGSEDCLFLNVFTPSLPDTTDGYPVLIWIHGGGFRRGAACQYEMRNLLKKQLVVVSIQYRLGSLGFLSTGRKELPGNNGMFDMVLAVNWVKDYIQFFGGNPKNVIAFGHGTGASSALFLALSKFCESTFNGVIAMSGSLLSHFAIDREPANTAKSIALRNGCPTNDTLKMIRCLQEVPVERLIRVDSEIENLRLSTQDFISTLSNLLGAGPVVEGSDDDRSLPNFITEQAEDSLKFGNFPAIPLLTGVVKDEIGGAISGKYKDEVIYKLQTIPNFLYKHVIPSLQKIIPLFGNKTQLVPETFNKYLNAFGITNPNEDITKVAEIMGDSLFNVPTYLTVDHWSRKAKTFLYTFDHNGKRRCSKDFLKGLPVVDAKDVANGATNHGDDLGYIFDPNTITGENIQDIERKSEADEQVTEVFTNMIANFARSNDLSTSTKLNDDRQLLNVIPTFSEDSNSFVSITQTPQVMKNFRYCEIGFWTGLANRLRSPACNFLKSTGRAVDRASDTIRGTFDTARRPIDTVEDVVTDLRPKVNTDQQRDNRREQKSNDMSSQIPFMPQLPFSG